MNPIQDEAPTETAELTWERVAAKAYELYVSRGRTEGHDLDDWLQAESELRSEMVSASTGDTLRPRLARARRTKSVAD